MNTPANMTQALDALKREILRETAELKEKETALAAAEAEKQTIKQAEAKLPEVERTIRKLSEDVKRLKLEQMRKNEELTKIHREFDEAARESKKTHL